MHNIIFNTADIEAAIARMAAGMIADNVYLIGILQGGARVADALQSHLTKSGCCVHRGDLDISFYRDDLDRIGPNPEVHPSHIPFNPDGKTVWVVDDVLYTGRTIRAALGEIFDYGRPNRVKLTVLLDRGGRELPIAADITGLEYATPTGDSVKLICNDPAWHIEQRRTGHGQT